MKIFVFRQYEIFYNLRIIVAGAPVCTGNGQAGGCPDGQVCKYANTGNAACGTLIMQ